MEVKSGSVIKTAAQAAFDTGVSIDSPALGIVMYLLSKGAILNDAQGELSLEYR